MYVVIVVFYGAELKFTGPSTRNFIVYPLLGCVSRPLWTFRAKNTPKCLFYQKYLFGAYILIDLLNFSEFRENM